MRVLLAKEYGWPGCDISLVLEKASNVDLTICQRDMFSAEKINALDFDAVLIYGPHVGSARSILQSVAKARDRGSRPLLMWWLNENLPPFGKPLTNMLLGQLRGTADRVSPPVPVGAGSRRRRDLLLHRYRLLHEVKLAKKWGVLDCLVTTSDHRSTQLTRLGLPAIAVPMGYGPGTAMGKRLGLERTIDVLFLGTTGGCGRARRRARKVVAIEDELRSRGIKLDVISGGLGGDERTETLNRTRILLNLVRSSEDWTGHRLILGAANGAMIVSEPMVDHGPFVDGTHLAFASPSNLASTIMHYLANESERRQMAENAYGLLSGELSMENCLSRVFAHANLPLEF